MAGAAFGDVAVSLFVAGIACGDVGASLFLAGAAEFRGARNVVFFKDRTSKVSEAEGAR